MNRLILIGLLAILVSCMSRSAAPVVGASPQLQATSRPNTPLENTSPQPLPNPQPFEGALVSIDVLRGRSNLDCIRCRATMCAGRALVRLLYLGQSGELEPCGDGIVVFVSDDFEPNALGYGCITRYTSYDDQPHQILSHILDERTGTFEPDIVEVSWALVTIKP